VHTTRTIETIVGVFVAIGLAALFFLAMQVSNFSAFSGDGFDLTARFESIGGLKERAAVAMGGVKIGEVSNIDYDVENFEAVVTLHIEAKFLGELKEMTVVNEVREGDTVKKVETTQKIQFSKLPDGTSASVYTAGLLGEQYVSLLPGSSGEEEETYLAVNGEIALVNDALILEEVIGRLVFSLTEGGGSE